jgi:hypothetical protein
VEGTVFPIYVFKNYKIFENQIDLKSLLNGVTLDPTIKHQSQKTYEFKCMEYVLDKKLI